MRSPRPILLTLVTLVAAVFTALVTTPAHASTVYTWTAGIGVTGADHHSWGNPANWNPQGVPKDGDAVIVQPIPGQGAIVIDGIQPVTLDALTIQGDDTTSVTFGATGESLSVAGVFTWTGGLIKADLTIDKDAHAQISPGWNKDLWGHLDVLGYLQMVDASVALAWADTMTIEPGGQLTTTGHSGLTGGACCTWPNRLVNAGTIDVHNGRFRLEGIELDQGGELHVAGGASLVSTAGLGRLYDQATYTGGGTLRFDHTAAPNPDPQNLTNEQGALLLLGKGTFSDGFTLMVGPGAALTGTGTLAGRGHVDLRGGTVYAHLTTGSATTVTVDGSALSRMGVWSPTLAGYHAEVVALGKILVVPGSTLNVDNGTKLDLRKGASLVVPGGARVGAGTCCSTQPTVVAEAGSIVKLGGGVGTAHLSWISLRTAGQTTLRGGVVVAGGSFVQSGGTTTLAAGSRLRMTHVQDVVTGGTLQGVGRVEGTLLNIGGTVEPGLGTSPASLTVDKYVQRNQGRLEIRVSKTVDQRLVINRSATLAGRLYVNGQADPNRRPLTIVSADAIHGRFGNVNASWQVAYGPTRVTVVG